MTDIEKIISSLGEPTAENKYSLKVINGEWWIEHDAVGSGYPVEDWLKRALWNEYIGRDLEFIARINRDGSGTMPMNKHDSFLANEYFSLTPLSLTEGTYIANGFDSYVVKKKK
jgi:hypothetical protein